MENYSFRRLSTIHQTLRRIFMMKLFFLSFLFILSAHSKNHSFDIFDAAGKKVGSATIKAATKGSLISVKLEAAEPGSKASHLHEKGLCEGPRFTSAGGHFNPEGKQHGHLNPGGAHLGDLGNIDIAANGKGQKEVKIEGVGFGQSFKHRLDTESGTSLVIHSKADDEQTDPAGNAGDRIYCGVVSAPKSPKIQ
jgi:Cu-Zn family superoxide dismutase